MFEMYTVWIQTDFPTFYTLLELNGKDAEGDNGRDVWMLSTVTTATRM